jgi:hypothetical protein
MSIEDNTDKTMSIEDNTDKTMSIEDNTDNTMSIEDIVLSVLRVTSYDYLFGMINLYFPNFDEFLFKIYIAM